MMKQKVEVLSKFFISFFRSPVIFIMFLTVPSSGIYCQETTERVSGELLMKANQCFENQQYDSAIIFYEKVLSLPGLALNLMNASSMQKKNLAAQVSVQIANIYMLKEEYPRSESWYHKALNLVDSLPDLKAEIYQNLGSLYFFKEHYEYAILYYEKSWMVYLKNPLKNPDKIIDLLISLGTAYSENSEYLKSYNCFHKADSLLSISNENEPLHRAGLHIDIGDILIKLDDPGKALTSYRSAYELAHEMSISCVNNFNFNCHMEYPLLSFKVCTNNVCMDISRTNLRFLSMKGMAACYSDLGQGDSAMICLEKCLALITKNTGSNLKRDSSRIFLSMGNVRFSQKKWEKSMNYYNKALEMLLPDSSDFRITDPDIICKHEDDLMDLYKIYGHLGKSHLKSAIQADLDTVSLLRSFSDFIVALKICDHISEDFGRGISLLRMHESAKPILAGALESGFMLKLKRGEKNFNELLSLADASKNRLLLEDIDENRFLSLTGVPDSVIKNIEGIKDEIVLYSKKYLKEESLSGTSSFSGLSVIRNRVIDLRMKLDSLRKEIGQYSIDHSIHKYQIRKSDPDGIMKNLRNDEAMLEYFCSDSIIYLFLARQEGSFMERVVIPSSFHYSLMECLRQLKSAGIKNFSTLSHTLYSYLIAPLEPRLTDIHRLIIIPDEELFLFPFETLIREDHDEVPGKISPSWHYLLKDFEISYHFSAEAWLNDTINNGSSKTATRFAGFAPGFYGNPDDPFSPDPLPFSLKEVTDIARLFRQVPEHHQVFLDSSATKKNFLLHAPGNTHIHIATHSLISDEDPMNSALLFSRSAHPDQYDNNDGLLHIDEINNLQLNASLVVLSACATGKGEVTHTEGVLTFTRGFYLAGASNIVYSLWNIPDHFTSEFMLSFYRNYFSGKSYSAALREVKLKMISNPETSLPYMWAGIVLLGRN